MVKTLTLVLLAGLILLGVWIFPWSEWRNLDFDNPSFYDTEVTQGVPHQVETAREYFFDRPLDPATATGLELLSEVARSDFFPICAETLQPFAMRSGASGVSVIYECEIENQTAELQVCRNLAWGPLLPHMETQFDIAGRKLNVLILALDAPVEPLPYGRHPDCGYGSVF